MTYSVYAILSVILVSLVSLIGVVFLNKDDFKKETSSKVSFDNAKYAKYLPFLVSFAVGGLLGDAFIHLLPESFEKLGRNLSTSLYIIAGLLFFFALEKFVRWEHCQSLDEQLECSVNATSHATSTMVLVGDAVHNFIDGVVIGASYTISIPIGISTTLAVFFHEIPQEMGDLGVLLHSGYSVKKALLFNFLTALTAILGTIITLIIGPHFENFATSLLPFTAGGFIYIACSDLIPELHREMKVRSSINQLLAIIFGIAIMVLLTFLD